MKYALFVACLYGGLLNAQMPSQVDVAVQSERVVSSTRGVLERTISVDFNQVPMASALQDVARLSNTRIQYRAELVDRVVRSITLRADNITLGKVLRAILDKTGLQAVPYAENIVTIKTKHASVKIAEGVIAGVVRSAKTKRPIANASITLDDGSVTVHTDGQGRFRMQVSAGERRVIVRAIGFQRVVQTVMVPEDGTTEVEVFAEATTNILNEVVVTGTVVATKRRAIPNPITVITAEEIERRGITRVEQLLRGEVPGVIALDHGSNTYSPNALGAMATSEVYSRGSSKIGGSGTSVANPLKTYIDGVELLDPSYLGTIDPSSIERIEIITGPQAATVYGSGAMGGVMQIFTKRGQGRSEAELSLSVKYGVLQNSLSSGLTPSHDDRVGITGGLGAGFSYTMNLSHRFIGQWRPMLFSRNFGASAGVVHTKGPVRVQGSVSITAGSNGTGYGLSFSARELAGERASFNRAPSQVTSSSSSQTVSLNADYSPLPFWQHHLTIGRNQTDFSLDPQSPNFKSPTDTLFRSQGSNGRRTTLSYNTTVQSSVSSMASSTLTLGMTGSWGEQTRINGCLATILSNSYVGCTQTSAPRIDKPMDIKNWGGFGSWSLGLFDQLYITLGLRGERNPNYGIAHKVDWTPANGVTYTVEFGDMTVKVLGSYGRATRPPTPDQRMDRYQYNVRYDPNPRLLARANPSLTPEYSRGPQGGVELYYGGFGSLTINRYDQKITDLIEYVPVDTSSYRIIATDEVRSYSVYSFLNTASIRQQGWELTGSGRLGYVTLKGTYSWSDARIIATSRNFNALDQPGQSFTGSPTHTGNITMGYAYGPTSITLVTNFMGRMLKKGCDIQEICDLKDSNIRHKMYAAYNPVFTGLLSEQTVRSAPGYSKSDLAASHRMKPWATFTVNITNLGNSHAQDGWVGNPVLGRQTLLGIALRYP